MKHEITIEFETLINIVCAAAAFYKECQQKWPESFKEEEAKELKTAIKIKHFCTETSALEYTIKDQE